MVYVYMSRHTPGLKPGDGGKISWEIGEKVHIISGMDEGRVFVIQSERKSHPAAPSGYVREGYFLDDKYRVTYAKSEDSFWWDQPPHVSHP